MNPICKRILWLGIALLALALPVAAHIGSPNVFFEGPAGPYPVRVTIQPPGVVPGLAQIHIRVLSGAPTKVTALPVKWDAGTRGAPPPDEARLVPGGTNLYYAQLWLMESGSFSVFVDVSGPAGAGTAIVPLNSVAYERLTMSPGRAVLFSAFGVFITLLLASVVGAAVRESSLAPGEQPGTARRRVAIVATTGALGLIGAALFFGNRWWQAVDREYLHNQLYQAEAISPVLSTNAQGHWQLDLTVAPSPQYRADNSRWIPDHGHLVHLFMVRKEGDVFAHLHPGHGQANNSVFTLLPALPAGDYQLYADITHESGFTETLTNRIHLPAALASGAAAVVGADADDAFSLATPKAPGVIDLDDGFRLIPHLPPSLKSGEDITLRFEITTADGKPAPLEPYLGMFGHLIIQRDDGGVFSHVHPLGTISMASQKIFAEREHAGYLANQPLELLCAPPTRDLAFPYAFPQPGKYRVWLQAKLNGQIYTVGYLLTVG